MNNQSGSLVAEFAYNGLGHRIGWHYDVDGDASVENSADDPWVSFAYDNRWRVVATFWEGADPDAPYEQFAYHRAGLDGHGGSSYIDAVVLRDRDEDLHGQTLEARVSVCHNWRADASALITGTGKMPEWVKYSAFGVHSGHDFGTSSCQPPDISRTLPENTYARQVCDYPF